MSNQFKVGDRVRILEVTGEAKRKWKVGDEGKVVLADVNRAIVIDGPDTGENRFWDTQLEVISKGKRGRPALPKVAKYILQYELDSDPFEVIYTRKELLKRIQELAERRDLKRDSIKVYEIKKVSAVSLSTRVTIKRV